eukprot:jgi/Botrbrau1/11752/Bobra.0195s0077.1
MDPASNVVKSNNFFDPETIQGNGLAVLDPQCDLMGVKIDWLDAIGNTSVAGSRLPDLSPGDLLGKEPNLVSAEQNLLSGSPGHDAGNRTIGEKDTRAADTPQGKAQKAKERNRKAVQKFRERQKARALEKDAELARVRGMLEKMQEENRNLQMHITALESRRTVASSKLFMCACGGDGHEHQRLPDFIPFVGWNEFNPAATLVLTAKDPCLRLSPAHIKRMQADDLVPIWRTYINIMGSELSQLRSDPASQAADRLLGFKNEVKALCAYFTLLNPKILHTIFNCCWMDTRDLPFNPPTLEQFGVVAASLNLDLTQKAKLLKARQLHDMYINSITRDQAKLSGEIHGILARPEHVKPGPAFLDLVDKTQSLTITLEKAHRVASIFGTQSWELLDPVQFATFMVVSYPWTGDMLSLVEHIDYTDGSKGKAPTQEMLMLLDDNSALSREMLSGFSFLWRWHADNMNAAISGQSLKQIPAVLRLIAN